MTELSIFNEVISHQLKGMMLHFDMANMYDFMGLKGFKRMHEYHGLHESAEMRGVCRYLINHIGYLPNANGNDQVSIIPSSWLSATKFNVSESDRKSKVKELYVKWHDWETKTKSFYQSKFKELCDLGSVASADKINELICDVDNELKHVEREFIEYSSVGWDMVYIMDKQCDIHDKYEKLTSDKIHVCMC